MAAEAWNIGQWKQLLEIGGTISALLFTGIALHIDARVRRAETVIELTKQHRELWNYYYDHPRLASLFDIERNIVTRPLAEEEINFINLLFLHLRASFYAHRARIYVEPDGLSQDIQKFFAFPAPLACWERLRKFHDRKFVAFVERKRKTIRP